MPDQRQGRERRIGVGCAQLRLLKRHEVLRGSLTGPRVAAFGHNTSVAATIAAASSSVGAGDIVMFTCVILLSRFAVGRIVGRWVVVDRPGFSGRASDDAASELVVERSALRVGEGQDEAEEQDRRDQRSDQESTCSATAI